MLQRQVSFRDVMSVLRNGEVIGEEEVDGRQVVLLLGSPHGRVIHIVVARYPGPMDCLIVTAYDPSPMKWDPDFKRRRR
jgi:hypothetical protein